MLLNVVATITMAVVLVTVMADDITVGMVVVRIFVSHSNLYQSCVRNDG